MKKFKAFSLTLFIAIFSCILNVHAQSTGYITGYEVRFRSMANTGTSSIIYEYLNRGTRVTLNNTNKVTGVGCDEGWYSVVYNNKNGYICSSYISLTEINISNETYLPWTSPKKAIFGGAQFISSDYIAQGQNTSYLKKYNVNPNSGYSLYNHQYMANLAAPMNEALSSYKSYKENNLLALPLQFTIPVFLNMPNKTAHPVTGEEKGGTSIVTDKEFEKKLEEQKFPETYRVWLREIHKTYPNWTFTAMHTGLDFNTAVQKEKWVSSINKGSCAKCIDASNTNTEGNWYVANNETTAYFLDPRNFLMADSILMFEDLGYSNNYTETVVQSILKDTFMSGVDPIDKIPYKTIFTEAGKTHNISPVYLASLARQEVGTKGGLVTSGERFTYKGNTYEGFYNFFNIGAYSSEENPAKAGLVYASQGSSKNAQGVFMGNTSVTPQTNTNKPNENTQSKPSENNTTPSTPAPVVKAATYLNKMKLNQKGNYVTNISVGQTVGELKAIVGEDVVFKNSSGTTLGLTEKLATGQTMTFKSGEVLQVVIYGDLTGDGQVNSADLLKMRLALLKKTTLSGAFDEASHIQTISGQINSADLLRLRQHLLGKKYINQA